MKRLKVLDRRLLATLNQSSLRAGRRRTLRPELIPNDPQGRYPINVHMASEREARICVVLNAVKGQTAWLDISAAEFAAIPEVEVTEVEWEAVQCVSTPRLTT